MLLLEYLMTSLMHCISVVERMNIVQIKILNSAFYKLLFSYAILTVIVTTFIGGTSYYFVSKSYKQEIEINNKLIIQYESSALETAVFDKIRKIYMDLSSMQVNNETLSYFTKYPVETNHIMLTTIVDSLKQCVNLNPDVLESICIYYVKNNIALSSTFGFKKLEEQRSELQKEMEWISFDTFPQKGWQWILIKQPALTKESRKFAIALTGRYPWSYNSSSYEALIALYIKPTILESTLRKLTEVDEKACIIDDNGNIINGSHLDNLSEAKSSGDWRNEILNAKKDYESFIGNVDGGKYFIYYAKINGTNWKLVRMTPIRSFYSRSLYIQRILFAICFITLIVGLILANIFSFRIYNPLKLLVNLVRQISHDTIAPNVKQNEYTLINGAIANLSVELSDFKNMLRINQPIIRYNLVSSLLNTNIENEDELDEYLRLLGFRFKHLKFNTLFVTMEEKVIRSMPVENQQYIKYHLLSKIESYNDDSRLLISTILDNNNIGIIINSSDGDDSCLEQLSLMIGTYIKDSLNIRVAIAAGLWVNNSLNIGESFKSAKQLMKYRYFTAQDISLLPRSLLLAESSKEKFQAELDIQFEQALNGRQLTRAIECIAQLAKFTSKGIYSAEYSIARINGLCQIIINFGNRLSYEPMDKLEQILLYPCKYIWKVSELEILLKDIISEMFSYIDKQSNLYNVNMVETLKKYICENLDKILSLDSLADIVHLNPKYLSRLFKDISGENITDYINQRRMEKACMLLQNTKMTVEDIGIAVGFNNYPYFIRRFKEMYGYTPKIYQTMLLKQEDNNRE